MLNDRDCYEVRYRSRYEDGRDAVFTSHHWAKDEDDAKRLWLEHFGINPCRTLLQITRLP